MSDNEDAVEEKQPQLKEDRTFVSFFKSLGDKPSDLVRIFDRKGYYSVHGDDAEMIALMHFKSTKAVKHWADTTTPAKKTKTSASSSASSSSSSSSDKGLACITLREGIEFKSVIERLFFEKKCRVEIWASEGSHWKVVRKGSPGNLQNFDDMFGDDDTRSAESPIVMAIKIVPDGALRTVGVAYADANRRILGVSQFSDTDLFPNLEHFLLQVGARECLLSLDPKAADGRRVYEILEQCGVPSTRRPPSDFKATNIEQDLKRLLRDVQSNLPELEQKCAMEAANCVILYLELLASEQNFGQYKMERVDINKYMKLDAAAFNALHIVPNTSEGGRGMSLYNLLNKCKTSMGSRKLMLWIKQPLLSKEDIERRQDFVEALYDDNMLRASLRDKEFKRIPDLDRLRYRVTSRKAKLQDVVTLYDVVQRLEGISETVAGYVGKHGEILEQEFGQLRSIAQDFELFTNMVEETIDLDAVRQHEYMIKASFEPALQRVYETKQDLAQQMEGHRERVALDLGMNDASKVKMDVHSSKGYYFQVARSFDKKVQENKSFDVFDTKKTGVRFQTKKLVSLGKQYLVQSKEYDEGQRMLVAKVMDIVDSYTELIEALSDLLGKLDVFASLAHVAATAGRPYVRPLVHDMGKGDIRLVESRHPCVEAQDNVDFIPNDVNLARNRKTFHIITGPNMGGKSTYIRQIGVITLMAQIGCFVPCSEAEVSIVDRVLCRVGAGDSQLRGVSTFMAEMSEISYILRSATSHSLIIIDELGRGTSTYDGFGLASAISQYICADIKCFCLFATHFHELTDLEKTIPEVANLHVSALTEKDKLTLLYQVQPGPCDQSFGIHVAELANFPKEVVDLARKKADELENFATTPTPAAPAATPTADDEGVTIVRQLLAEFAGLPLDTCTPSEALEAVARLRNAALASGNSFVMNLTK